MTTNYWSREVTGGCVVATWSGGIDSTAVVCELISRGIDVLAVSFLFGGDAMLARENEARSLLFDAVRACGPGKFDTVEYEAEMFLDAVRETGGLMIPNRNKRFLDLLMSNLVIPRRYTDVAMGEYVGADTWLVKDHVHERDADARYLESYLLQEYGAAYRLWTLRDFGLPQRYKVDRLRILAQHVPISLTTNCLLDGKNHCGKCYKCVERAAAFDFGHFEDETVYDVEPRESSFYTDYYEQQNGGGGDVPFSAFELLAP